MNKKDILILRSLACQKKSIALQKENSINERLWTLTNDLKMTIPPIYINEICWHEMNYNDELTLQTKDIFCQNLEQNLRKEIYLWNHMRGNMVVSDFIECPIITEGEHFGIIENVDIAKTDNNNDVVSRHFNIQIQNEDDINKIKTPCIRVNWALTNRNFELMQEIFSDTIEVRLCGKRGYWFTPWDNLIRWTGIEPIMFDLIERPEYVKSLVTRFVDASISLLNQYNKLNIWASNNTNCRVGSGGYGYTDDLDSPLHLDTRASTNQLWGCGNAQIFSSVSQSMHFEFSLEQEIRWLSNFGLNYYGCCEPLHYKMDIMNKIPNLRKISVSPWCNIREISELANNKYVLSCKPNPAIFSTNNFDEDYVRNDLKKIFSESLGCSIELVLKDISTVSYKPEHLWRWYQIACEEIKRFYN
ncbi:MAG: hypothetical protein RR746_08180 [Lachnospiraceae bacterium]